MWPGDCAVLQRLAIIRRRCGCQGNSLRRSTRSTPVPQIHPCRNFALAPASPPEVSTMPPGYDESALRAVGVVFSADVGLPICLPCQAGLRLDGLARHLRDRHQTPLSLRNAALASASAACEAHTPSAAHLSPRAGRPQDLLPQVRGLKVFHDGVECECHLWYSGIASLRAHASKAHAGAITTRRRGRVQSVLSGNSRAFFPIEPSAQATPAAPSAHLSQAQFSVRDALAADLAAADAAPAGATRPPDDPRAVSGFLSELPLHKTLDRLGVSWEVAWRLASEFDYYSDADRTLREACAIYIARARDMARVASIDCLQAAVLPRDDGVKLVFNGSRHTTGTIQRYSRHLAHAATWCIRCAESGDEAVQAMWSKFGLDQEARALSQKTRGGDPSNANAALHALLIPLLVKPFGATEANTPIAAFIACAVVTRSASGAPLRLGRGKDISPTAAGLQCAASFAALYHIYKTEDPQARVESKAEIDEWITGSANGSLAALRRVLRVAAKTRQSEHGIARVIECGEPDHGVCGWIDGHELGVGQLRSAIVSMQDKCYNELFSIVLFGERLPDGLPQSAQGLVDNVSCEDPGYFFGSDASLSHLQDNIRVWVASTAAAHVWPEGAFDAAAASRWSRSLRRARALLSTCVFLTVGGPFRSTEQESIRVRNTALAVRDLYIIRGDLVFIAGYSKVRAAREGSARATARVPDKVTTRLLLAYILLALPLQAVIECRQEGGAERHSAQHEALTALVPLSRDGELSFAIAKALKDEQLPPAVSKMRQWQTWCVKRIMPPPLWREAFGGQEHPGPDDDAGEGEYAVSNAAFEQAGHSVGTAMSVYGLTSADLRGVSPTQVEAQMSASHMWHRVISGVASGFDRTPSARLSLTAQELKVMLTQAAAQGADKIMKDMRAQGLIVKIDAAAGADKSMKGMRAQDALEKINLCDSGARAEDAEDARRITSIQCLRTLLNCNDATFSCKIQELAIDAALTHGARDHLVIMATGAGKSAVFMAPAAGESGGDSCGVSLVIFPLRALRDDMEKRLSAAGIRYARVQDLLRASTVPARVQVVVASAEDIEGAGFRRITVTLSRQRRLRRIVADEAHLYVLWAEFRPALSRAWRFIRGPEVVAPLFLLTATCPPSATGEVIRACGGAPDEVIILRSPTTRANLRYRVIRCQDQGLHAVEKKCVDLVDAQRSLTSDSRIIVFCRTRMGAERVRSRIGGDSRRCLLYHAGMTEHARSQSLSMFLSASGGGTVVLCATVAFGVGVDCGAVRHVFHVGSSGSLAEYCQESGRAGRDGLQADCTVVTSQGLLSSELESRPGSSMFGDFSKWASQDAVCRRFLLQEAMDGFGIRCADLGASKCDVCEDVGCVETLSQSTPALSTPAQQLPQQSPPSFSPPAAESLTKRRRVCNVGGGLLFAAAQGRVAAADIEVESMRADYFGRLCAVCLVAGRCESECVGANGAGVHDRRGACMAGRCLRCLGKGHDAAKCPYIASRTEKDVNGCLRCYLHLHRKQKVHNPGEYGTRKCPLQGAVMAALACFWEPRTRDRLLRELRCDARTPLQFCDWVLNDSPSGGVGAVRVADWVRKELRTDIQW